MIEVIRMSPDKLSRERWIFSYATYPGIDRGVTVSLSSYHCEDRETARHRKWAGRSYWDASFEEDFEGKRILYRAKVPGPSDVLQEVYDTIVTGIRFAPPFTEAWDG